MSRFYGSVSGSAGTAATRQGTAWSGIESHTRGWETGVRVWGDTAEVDPKTDPTRDRFVVEITGGSNGGTTYPLATVTEMPDGSRRIVLSAEILAALGAQREAVSLQGGRIFGD